VRQTQRTHGLAQRIAHAYASFVERHSIGER
jgi:hypothetical protein